MGVKIELNCEHGNGNQIFDRESWSWFNAKDQLCEVTIARNGGGDLTVKLLGAGNNTPVTFTKTPVNAGDKNVYIGVIDTDGSAFFSDVRDEGATVMSPADFGWDTDEIDGKKDFSGWGSIDGINITADFAKTTGNHRIWKSLISDQKNFAVTLTYTAAAESSGYIKLLGQTLELDNRGANGNQIGVKLNGTFIEWIDLSSRSTEVWIIRNSRDIVVSIAGSNGIYRYTMTPSEENENLELGVYAGNVAFNKIKAGAPDESLRQVPFGTVSYGGELASGWTDILTANITEYQSSKLSLSQDKADLIVYADGLTAFTSGVSAEDFLLQYAEAVAAQQAKLNDGGVLVLTGLPYIAGDIDTVRLAAYNAGVRAVAERTGALYADLYAAMGERDWTLSENGFTAVGQQLVAGEILEQLMRNCTCLAVNTNDTIKGTKAAPVEKTDAALAAFNAANTAETVKAAVENEALGLNLRLYQSLTSETQNKALAKLAETAKNAADFTEADAIFNGVVMDISRSNPKEDMTCEIKTYVSVGDSITEGIGAVNGSTDPWAPRLALLLKDILGDVTYINNGISGTRMSSEVNQYPAAKDTVDDYIAAYQPDLLTVAYGINDYHAGTSKETFLSDYRTYVNEIRTKCPDTVIVLCSITAKAGEQSAADIRAWNSGIQAIAEEYGCIYADTYDDMRGVEWLLSDGLHPNNAGYRVMANAVLRAINGYVELKGEPVVVHTPDEFGWETDEIGGVKDFSGWAAEDAANISAEYNATTGEHRIWKNLLTNQNDFTAELDIITDNTSSAYVKVLGITLELDSSGGDGNQSFVKLNGQNQDWVRGDNCEMHVKLERKDGGDLTITVTGKNGDTMDLTAKPTEENENLELGLYRGIASYKNITVTCEAVTPATYLVTFVDGLTNETISTVKVEEGNAATAPEAPAHEGYTFKGWDKDFSNVTADLTVTAQYEKNEEPPKPTEYTVTFVDGLTGETIATDAVEEGNAATAPVAPAHEGYTFKGWDKDFSNVTSDLTVTAQYEKNEEPPKPWVNPFKDVKEIDWYYEGVKFAAQNELFNGTSPTTFEPDGDMTRAMLVTVLWRLDGKPAPKSTNSFKDVPGGQWYTEAVAWASENGVVDGVGNNLFEPDGNVTREQIAAIMYRYAGKKGYDTTKRADLSKYPDEGQVSSYAKEALSWANAEGLINGTNNGKGDVLDPKGSATRAQVSTILMRYVENIVQK